ncbi:tetratricopeptide repeat protein [Azospirillum sp. sgz301742]
MKPAPQSATSEAITLEQADALFAEARHLYDSGNSFDAARICNGIVDQHPAHWPSAQLLGALAYRQGNHQAATMLFRHALRQKPDSATLRGNLAVALRARGDIDVALRIQRSAVEADPTVADIHFNHANALQHAHRFDEAITAYRHCLILAPGHVEAHWNLAMAYLRTGRFAQGWPEYEWRWRRPGAPPADRGAAPWTGEAFAGKTLLVFIEQGLGDTIQFARYLPAVAERGGDVVFECQPDTLALMAGLGPRIRAVGHGEPLPPFDLQVSLMSLPGIFGTTPDSIPSHVPYLHSSPSPMELPGPGALNLGIVWGSSPTNPARNCPLDLLLPLAEIPGVRLFSLQKGEHAKDLATTPTAKAMTDLSGALNDFSATARAIMALDLIVTVDTSVAHLAGALARPTWILLPHLADWRWLLEREDSPWYPTVRLFRQPAPGDWATVTARLHDALHLLVTGTAHTDRR